MKKLLFNILFTLSINIFYLHAGSVTETQEYTEVTLEIQNMTNETISFFYDGLLQPRILEPQGNWKSLRTPMGADYYGGKPVFPAFFALEYSNGVFEFYQFYESARMGVKKIDLSYVVRITEDGAHVSPGTESEVYNYHRPDWVFQKVGILIEEGFYWEKSTWSSFQAWFDTGKKIELLLINNTDNVVVFDMNTSMYTKNGEDEQFWQEPESINIRKTEKLKIYITDKIITLNKNLIIDYSFFTGSLIPKKYQIYMGMINFACWPIQSLTPSCIVIKINDSGYDIQFVDYN